MIPEIVLELLEQVLMGTHPLTPSTNIIGASGSPPSNSSRSSTIGNPSSPPPNQFLVLLPRCVHHHLNGRLAAPPSLASQATAASLAITTILLNF